jgi:hypothetical protein
MSILRITRYTKPGATFANGNEAHADKNSLYTPELQESVDNCYATMLANGVLLEPLSFDWDQETSTLSVNKLVSSQADYLAAITFDAVAVVEAAADAGWTIIPE